MSSLLGKLFSHNGKVPWLQLIVGIVLGVLGSLGWVKFKRPAFIVGDATPDVITGGDPLACPMRPAPKRRHDKATINSEPLSIPMNDPEEIEDECEADDFENFEAERMMSDVLPVPIYVSDIRMRKQMSPKRRVTEIEESDESQAPTDQ